MEECVAVPPSSAVEPARRPNLELRIRLPAPLLLSIDALIGERFIDRGDAVRALLYAGLRAQP
jgi:hypothetical protein